ncbi:MBL fold metallo-hydrolase [Telmatospirillum sp. J64-1]|uniref:MBL fold metallo-hydrolase n=1 Tax=Telmatospirillum sp. J64-1 TaxID=2502183 RepID=UPI00115EABFC|nr:MBL fold metallo-hydrolase [Telmatospirillum sp. J64-1]
MTISLEFHGAAQTVTGSCTLIRHPKGNVLVDCGLFQGSKTLRELNYGTFPFDPGEIDAVLVTHAHIDHSGLIPKLCRKGFKGRVLTSESSRDLLTYMLPDSGYIQEMEVERLNRRNAQRGRAAVSPIYTKADAEEALGRIDGVAQNEWIAVQPGLRARFWNAGHILGASSIEIEVETGDRQHPVHRLFFSGDIGRDGSAFHAPPEGPAGVDFLVMESTYGDRERPPVDVEKRRAILREEVLAALKARGNLIIPVFAVERTQELLADLGALFDAGEIPVTQVFLDSPLAIRATEVFTKHARELGAGDQPEPFRRPNVHFIEDVEHSKRLNHVSGSIILSASGMCDAGRIRFHLQNNLWRPEATVLLVGYQAPGTLGALLESGVKQVRMMGQEITVAARIRKIEAYSGHADRGELLAWLKARLPVRRALFLCHGEPHSMESLRQGIIEMGLDPELIVTPELGERIDLTLQGRLRHHRQAVRGKAVVQPLDWHNDYAAFLLDLQQRLQDTADDRQRDLLLRRLKRALVE